MGVDCCYLMGLILFNYLIIQLYQLVKILSYINIIR